MRILDEMKRVIFCQSCGMPLQTPEHFGTEEDGSASLEYCCYCYKGGSFAADCTMEEMIVHCLGFLDEFNADQGTRLTREQAAAEMKKFFPTLKRWEGLQDGGMAGPAEPAGKRGNSAGF